MSPRRMKSKTCQRADQLNMSQRPLANLGEEFQPTKMHLSHSIANMASTLHAQMQSIYASMHLSHCTANFLTLQWSLLCERSRPLGEVYEEIKNVVITNKLCSCQGPPGPRGSPGSDGTPGRKVELTVFNTELLIIRMLQSLYLSSVYFVQSSEHKQDIFTIAILL